MHRVIHTTLILLVAAGTLWAQELNLEVRVNAPALTTADPKTITSLERAVKEFFNDTKWTNDSYESHERIEGSIQINIKDDLAANSFVADMYITTARPVYESSYSSPVLNHVDKNIRFIYSDLDPIRDNRNNFTDNLSSILTFYAYIILGYDYDTFSAEGGDEHFRIANSIVAAVPPTITKTDGSWTAKGGDRNRYWLMENLMDPKIKRFRKAMYDYHRSGLDRMSSDSALAKAIMLSSLKELRVLNEARPNTMVAQMFTNSKRAEILEVFKNSVKGEQNIVYNLMIKVDPSQADFLRELK